MEIRIRRGTHQIGGSITEIKTAKARIIIDIGAELPSTESQSTPLKIHGVTNGAPNCDAVFVTHYHGDHVGEYEAVLDGTPIYIGTAAKEIFSVVQRTLKSKRNIGNPDIVDKFITYAPNVPIKIKDITVTPYSVDHSAFDAYALLIEAEGKRILHTGDFRMHGAKGSKMPAMYAKYCSDIDILITEGTMMSRANEKVMTEHELGQKAVELIQDNKYVFVLCSSTNIDSIAEFYNAAIKCRKPFVICDDDFQGEILRIVTKNSYSPFYNFNKRRVYTYSSRNQKLHDYMDNCGFCFLGRTNARTESAIKAFPDNALIYSMWQGYLDKSRPAYDEYKTGWIEKAVTGGSKLQYLHTGGHAGLADIKRLISITKPKIIIPIHSEKPEAFENLGIRSAIKILQDGDTAVFD